MVSAARKERDAADRKNDQLRAQLADTESLLASHQEQLAELKEVMAQMTKDREEAENGMSTGTPNTPRLASRRSKESLGRIFEALSLVPNNPSSPSPPSNSDEIPPCPPTALINLVHPVLRHDTTAYRDFCEAFSQPKPSPSGGGGSGDARSTTTTAGRLSGGSFTSIQTMGLGMGLSMASPGQSASSIGSSLFGIKKRTDSGSTTHSPTGSTSSAADTQAAHLAALKESKFFKRVMMEDIEPTLRLDCAPGLSWLARRNVMSAITEGSLVVDPMPTSPRVTIFACALCGENQADEQHARTHRMRISDTPSAQRYPLCWFCTNRLRSVCDFLAFLRTLKEGLWKCESEGDQKHAWEESVKLREALFWARIGGGVIFSVHSAAFRELRDEAVGMATAPGNAQTETPPRTPVLETAKTPTALDAAGKLDLPKRRSNANPFLTPEKQRVPSPLDLSASSGKPLLPSAVNGMNGGARPESGSGNKVYEMVGKQQREAPSPLPPPQSSSPSLSSSSSSSTSSSSSVDMGKAEPSGSTTTTTPTEAGGVPLPPPAELTMRPKSDPCPTPPSESTATAGANAEDRARPRSPTLPGGW